MEEYPIRYSDSTYRWLSGMSEAGEWLEIFGRIAWFPGYYDNGRIFTQPAWRRIGLPISFVDNDLAPDPETGKCRYAYAYPELQRHWFSDFLKAAQQDNGSTLCIRHRNERMSVSLVEPNPDDVRKLFLTSDSTNNYALEAVIFDASGRWGVYVSDDEHLFFAADREIMNRFFEIVGGERVPEYFFASGLNECRGGLDGLGIRLCYMQTDWDIPFDLIEGDGRLDREVRQSVIDRVEGELARKFGFR